VSTIHSCDNGSLYCSDTEKVQIQKVFSHYGFKYYLDAPTSSSVRREDDKVIKNTLSPNFFAEMQIYKENPRNCYEQCMGGGGGDDPLECIGKLKSQGRRIKGQYIIFEKLAK
jgi:hypothetical protein